MKIRQTRSPLDDMTPGNASLAEAICRDVMHMARDASFPFSDMVAATDADTCILLAMRPRKPTRIEWYAAQARESLGIEIP